MNPKHRRKLSMSTEDLESRPDYGWRRKLYIIIFEAETKAGRRFDIILLWMILLSVLAVILESDREIRATATAIFVIFEWVITVLFTIEYVCRLMVTKHPIRYAFSFYGLIDLVSILPTYISILLPGSKYFMVVRVLRLLRVFRILKLVRFVSAAQILGQALKESRYKIFVFLGVVLSMVLIMGTCMYIVEGQQSGFSSIPKSMYWTIVTMTTVGYGDIVPLTATGKFVASFMMLIGYAIIAVPTGIVTSELSEANRLYKGERQCGKCSEHVSIDSNYCQNCGKKLPQ